MKRALHWVPVVEWPWYWRWTAGMLLFVTVVVPTAVGIAIGKAVAEFCSSLWHSEAWRLLSIAFFAFMLGSGGKDEK